MAASNSPPARTKALRERAGLWLLSRDSPMNRCRMKILYSGRVQGVGFRYSVKSIARGYDVAGAVRNLADGRVELVVEGERGELELFQQAIRAGGLEGFIRDEDLSWHEAQGGFRGLEIVA